MHMNGLHFSLVAGEHPNLHLNEHVSVPAAVI